MTNEQLKALISQILPGSEITIGGDGHHFEATIIADEFTGLSRVKRQQMIYQSLSLYITSGAIHALNLTTYTPEEWKQHG